VSSWLRAKLTFALSPKFTVDAVFDTAKADPVSRPPIASTPTNRKALTKRAA
jgi:hypothetical protein